MPAQQGKKVLASACWRSLLAIISPVRRTPHASSCPFVPGPGYTPHHGWLALLHIQTARIDIQAITHPLVS